MIKKENRPFRQDKNKRKLMGFMLTLLLTFKINWSSLNGNYMIKNVLDLQLCNGGLVKLLSSWCILPPSSLRSWVLLENCASKTRLLHQVTICYKSLWQTQQDLLCPLYNKVRVKADRTTNSMSGLKITAGQWPDKMTKQFLTGHS